MTSHSSEEKVIRGLIDNWYENLGRGDAVGLAADYADDVAVASLAPPLWNHGKQVYVASMARWFSTFVEPLKGGPKKLSIVAGDSVAFVNGFSHIVGKKKDGTAMEMHMRLTVCFEKRNGRWQIVADHTSVPFDMQTYRPLIDLEE
jgi:Ketosteroid isomerase homolog